jgi:hypothetical protein
VVKPLRNALRGGSAIAGRILLRYGLKYIVVSARNIERRPWSNWEKAGHMLHTKMGIDIEVFPHYLIPTLLLAVD